MVAQRTPPRKGRRSIKKALLIFVVSLLVLFLAALIAIPPLVMWNFELSKPVTFARTYTPEDFGLSAEALTLTTEDGLNLAAWEVSAKNPKAAIVFVSGIQNPSVTAFFPHAKWLRDEGYSSVLVEMRAHGTSEGDTISLGMEEYKDVAAAVRYIKDKDPSLPAVVYGVSMGGATAVNAIGEIPELDGLISLSAYANWPDAFCYNMELMGIPSAFAAVQKPFVWLYMGFAYGFDRLEVNPLREIEKLDGRPALLMHSSEDSQVPFASFEKLYAKAPYAKTFVRQGDYHMIVDEHFDEPWLDVEYAHAIQSFLRTNFG